MNEQCPECGESLYIYTNTDTRYEHDTERNAEAIIYTDHHTCGGKVAATFNAPDGSHQVPVPCRHTWETEERGFYRIPGEVLDKLMANQKSVTTVTDDSPDKPKRDDHPLIGGQSKPAYKFKSCARYCVFNQN